MHPEALTPWFVLITSFFGAVTALGIAGMFLWSRLLWPGFSGLVEDAVEPMKKTLTSVAAIVEKELNTNGGTSIKDRVKELGAQSERVEKNLLARNKSTDAKLEGLDRRLGALEVRLSRETQKVIETVAAVSTPAAVATETLEVGKETLSAVEKVDTKLDEAMGKSE